MGKTVNNKSDQKSDKALIKLTLTPKEGEKKPQIKKIDTGDGSDFSIERYGVRYYDSAAGLVMVATWDTIDRLELDIAPSPAQKRYAVAHKMVKSENNKAAGMTPICQAVQAAKVKAGPPVQDSHLVPTGQKTICSDDRASNAA